MDSSDYIFRPAIEQDHTYLARLFWLTACYGDAQAPLDESYHAFRVSYVDHWDPTRDGGVIAFDSFGVPVGGCWLRYWRPGTPSGCANLGPDIPELAIAVEPHRNGTGLGRNLLTRICDLARNQGAKTIALHVDHANNRAQAIYERFGFVAAGTDPHNIGTIMTFQLAE